MRLLLTNDDGYDAPGIQSMARAAVRAGHDVTVIAPRTQQSATSHHITLSSPLMVREVEIARASAYAVEGTPADCVRLHTSLCKEKPDFCISGINNGENAGSAVYYSGTVSAAREASMLYLPSMAVSIERNADEDMRLALADIALAAAERLLKNPMPRLCICSINAPAIDPALWKPLTLAPLSQSFYLDGYERRKSPYGATYFWMEAGENCEAHAPGSDLALLQDGYVTCTFIGGFACHNAQYPHFLQD